MKKIILSSFILLWAIQGFGQTVFRMEKYLATAMTDQSLERYQSQLNFLEDNNYNAPWINRVELRVGSEDANASLNEYRLRISPSNPAEVKANKLYYNKHLSSLNTKHQIALNEALKNRYYLLIDLTDLIQKKNVLEEQIAYQEKILTNMNGHPDQRLEIKDLIDFQSDQTKSLLELDEIYSKIKLSRYYIELDYGTFVQNNEWIQDIISVDQIKDYLLISGQINQQNLEILDAEKELALSQQSLKIEKAESHGNLGYIQSNIDTERGNDITDRLGFQVGIRIPIVNPDKPSLNRDKVKLIEEEAELSMTKKLVSNKADINLIQINHQLDRYEMLSQRRILAQNMKLSSNVSWSDLSQLKNYQLELDLALTQIEKEIREKFIEYLDMKGLLVNEPLINYLSKNYNSIQESN